MIWLRNYFTNISGAMHGCEFSIFLFNTFRREKILWECSLKFVDMKINTTLSEAVRHALGLIGWILLGVSQARSTCLWFMSSGGVR